MKKFRILVFVALTLASSWARADTWAPPQTEVTLSANGQFRVTVVPRPLGGALPYFEDKVKGVSLPGQRKGEIQSSPVARVEKLEAEGTWRLVWQMPLVNDVGPPAVVLTNDGSFLVTFDNWHSAGYGDDVVVIYDKQGGPVRKLSLEQILPPAYVHHLRRSTSSRWWGHDHRLVDSDRLIELQIAQPGDTSGRYSRFVPVRIRLADGFIIPPSGKAWKRAMAKAIKLESQRLTAWETLRRLRASPLVAPVSRNTKEWRHYMFELRNRIAREGERMGGMLLAATGEDPGFHDAESISALIEEHDDADKYLGLNFILASPTSDRLAALLVTALLARAEGSMKNAQIVFVGTQSEGLQVVKAAKRSGANVRVIDRTATYPSGKPLPLKPPPHWMPLPAGF